MLHLEKMGDRRGLNPRPPESQSGALPTELRSPCMRSFIVNIFTINFYATISITTVSSTTGFYAISNIKTQCAIHTLLRQTSYHSGINSLRQKGFEPLTHGLEGRCSIQLSYWRKFGMTGFEPATPGSQNRCATTALHPASSTESHIETNCQD